jgi:hypothetical protein
MLDIAFPPCPDQLATDADLSLLLETLPKTLGEAFHRATQLIPDRRYEGRIFQLVAAARRPLNTTELAVALNVSPGNPAWNNDTMVKEPRSLPSACGGSLLWIDEEDDTVHFIHHSALLFLLGQPGTPKGSESVVDPSLTFTLEEAEYRMGCTCVTYLSHNWHDMSVSTPVIWPVSGRFVIEAIDTTVNRQKPTAKKLISMILARKQRRTGRTDINIAETLERVRQKSQSHRADLFFRFLPYAQAYWLDQTKTIASTFREPWHEQSYKLFRRLAYSQPIHAKVPWTAEAADALDIDIAGFKWAVSSNHASLMKAFLYLSSDPSSSAINRLIHCLIHLGHVAERREKISHRDTLDDAVAKCLVFFPPALSAAKEKAIEALLDLGASPYTPLRLAGSELDGRPPLVLAFISGQSDHDEPRICGLMEVVLRNYDYAREQTSFVFIHSLHRGWIQALELTLDVMDRSDLHPEKTNQDTKCPLCISSTKVEHRECTPLGFVLYLLALSGQAEYESHHQLTRAIERCLAKGCSPSEVFRIGDRDHHPVAFCLEYLENDDLIKNLLRQPDRSRSELVRPGRRMIPSIIITVAFQHQDLVKFALNYHSSEERSLCSCNFTVSGCPRRVSLGDTALGRAYALGNSAIVGMCIDAILSSGKLPEGWRERGIKWEKDRAESRGMDFRYELFFSVRNLGLTVCQSVYRV